MNTIIKSASVKVMLSHNCNHFETCMTIENDEGVTTAEIDEARKNCNRLCDKAIKQYDQAKVMARKQASLRIERSQLEAEVSEIRRKTESEWTVTDKAKVKALADYNWDLQWDYDDDEYDEDEEYAF